MENLSSEALGAILELRRQNGLEATEAALKADVEASKAKWTLKETPRYRKAGNSPVYVSGKYLTSVGKCPFTGEVDAKAATKPAGKAKAPKASKGGTDTGHGRGVSDSDFYKALHAKGFKIRIAQNLITGGIETDLPASITGLELEFGAIPSKASTVHVIQTSPQIQVALPLDKFLELAGIKG